MIFVPRNPFITLSLIFREYIVLIFANENISRNWNSFPKTSKQSYVKKNTELSIVRVKLTNVDNVLIALIKCFVTCLFY